MYRWQSIVAATLMTLTTQAQANTLEDVFAVQDTFAFDRPATEAVLAGDLILLRAIDGTLSAIRGDTGALVWRRAADLGAEMRFHVEGDTVVLTVPRGLEAVRRDNGMRLWGWAPTCKEQCRVRVVARNRTMTLMETSDGFWQAVRTDNGRELWRVKAPANVVGRVAISPHAIIVPSSSFEANLQLTFLNPDTGVETARWKGAQASGGAAPTWHESTRGARVLITRPVSPKGRAGPPDLAEMLIVDSMGKIAERRPIAALTGIGQRIAWSEATADEALIMVDDPPKPRAHILRLNERSQGRIEVEIATDLGPPFAQGEAYVFPPAGAHATWGLLRPGHKLWRPEIAGLSPATRAFALTERHGLFAHFDGVVEADIALEKVTGVGVLELDPSDPILAVGWVGRTPLIIQSKRVTVLKRMKMIEIRDKIKRAELGGVDTAPLRKRLGRFPLLKERLDQFVRLEDDFDPGNADDDDGGITIEAAPTPKAPATAAPKVAAPLADEQALAAAREAEAKTMALQPDETATLKTLRDAWLGGEASAVVKAMSTWLERASTPAAEPQRVASALGWMLYGVEVAPDRTVGLEWLLGPARAIVGARAGLPPASQIVWALIAARAGDSALAAEFLPDGDGGLVASARRSLAVRALKGMRDMVGDLRSVSQRQTFGRALGQFQHSDLLFGASAKRVKDLADRVGADPSVLSEIDGYLHVIGVKQVSNTPIDVEMCALGCDTIGARCGHAGDSDACVRRCLKSGAVRLAGPPRASPTDPDWYCGL